MVLKRRRWIVSLAGNFLFSSTGPYCSREQRVYYDLGRFKREIPGCNCLEEWKDVGYVPRIPSRKTYFLNLSETIYPPHKERYPSIQLSEQVFAVWLARTVCGDFFPVAEVDQLIVAALSLGQLRVDFWISGDSGRSDPNGYLDPAIFLCLLTCVNLMSLGHDLSI